MSVLSMIDDGRAMVEDTFIDVGSIVRPAAGAPSLNATTGVSTPAAATSVYSGRCRVKKPSQVEEEKVFGDINETKVRRLVNLPYTAPEIRIGDIFTATTSRDPEVLRTSMRVCAIGSTSTLMFRQLGGEVIEP